MGWRPSLLGLEAITSRLEAIAPVEAIARRSEAIARRLEAIASSGEREREQTKRTKRVGGPGPGHRGTDLGHRGDGNPGVARQTSALI